MRRYLLAGLSMVLLVPASAAAQDASTAPPATAVSTEYVDPLQPAWRSLVLPGWGQFHLGQTGRGQAYLGASLVGLAFGTGVITFVERNNSRQALQGMGWGLHAFAAVLSATDAWQKSEDRNRENGWLLEAALAPRGEPALALTRRF